jgi:prevent-host-death family protein
VNKRYSIAEARGNFAAIVHELERTRTVEITRRGQPVAVLLTKQEYDRLQGSSTGFWNAYTAFKDKTDLAELNIEPEEVFGDLRVRGSGRSVRF